MHIKKQRVALFQAQPKGLWLIFKLSSLKIVKVTLHGCSLIGNAGAHCPE